MSILGSGVADDSGAPDANIQPQGNPPDLGTPQTATPTLAPQPSRLLAILGAVARVGATGLAAGATKPASGRPSFGSGLAAGAQAEANQIAQDQAIKFQSFQDSVRAAQLHNEDVRMQWASEDHQNAVQANADAQAKRMTDTTGMTFTFVPNDDGGKSALDHMGVQMAQNGAVSVPAGTIAGPKGWYIPNQGSAEQAQALTTDFNNRAPFYGFNPVPKGGVVQSIAYDQLRHASNGLDNQGNPMSTTDLNNRVDNMSAQLEQYKKLPNANPNTIAAVQSHIDHLTSLAKHHGQRDDEAVAKGTAQAVTRADKLGAVANKYKEDQQDNAAANKAANAKQPDTTELNAVAYDPNYANPDGSKGANVVMSKEDAKAKGLQHYKVDASGVNSLVGSMNDVQNKLNQLADITNDPKRMGQVDARLSGYLTAEDDNKISALGANLNTDGINAYLREQGIGNANQATRDYITAYVGAREAVTQLPRLQTFGKSNRMTQQQMNAAVKLLPQPGDGSMAPQKMLALQQMIDPLRKQIPHMPGAEQIPSWLEQRQQRQRQQAPAASMESNLGQWVSGLQPK